MYHLLKSKTPGCTLCDRNIGAPTTSCKKCKTLLCHSCLPLHIFRARWANCPYCVVAFLVFSLLWFLFALFLYFPPSFSFSLLLSSFPLVFSCFIPTLGRRRLRQCHFTIWTQRVTSETYNFCCPCFYCRCHFNCHTRCLPWRVEKGKLVATRDIKPLEVRHHYI